MKIKYFGLGLDSEDFGIEDRTLISDFAFQVNYFTQYVQRLMQKEKIEGNQFQLLMLRGRNNPSDNIILKEHFKSLSIEFKFDKKRYVQLYPKKNSYPIENLLKPIECEKDFGDYISEIILQCLEKAKNLNAPIPSDFLINTVLDFKKIGYNNEWIHKQKTFREYGIKASLICKLTANFFSLTLRIEKSNREIFKNEILKTLPDPIIYNKYFKDIIISDSSLVVTKNMYENPPLFELSLSDLRDLIK